MTRKFRHLTRSHLEVAVGGPKLAYTVDFTSYKAVAPSIRQSLKGNDVSTSGDWKRPGSDVI